MLGSTTTKAPRPLAPAADGLSTERESAIKNLSERLAGVATPSDAMNGRSGVADNETEFDPTGAGLLSPPSRKATKKPSTERKPLTRSPMRKDSGAGQARSKARTTDMFAAVAQDAAPPTRARPPAPTAQPTASYLEVQRAAASLQAPSSPGSDAGTSGIPTEGAGVQVDEGHLQATLADLVSTHGLAAISALLGKLIPSGPAPRVAKPAPSTLSPSDQLLQAGRSASGIEARQVTRAATSRPCGEAPRRATNPTMPQVHVAPNTERELPSRKTASATLFDWPSRPLLSSQREWLVLREGRLFPGLMPTGGWPPTASRSLIRSH